MNLRASTEDKKEKEASSGQQRVKEGSESTLRSGGHGSQSGCEQISGGGEGDLHRLPVTQVMLP